MLIPYVLLRYDHRLLHDDAQLVNGNGHQPHYREQFQEQDDFLSRLWIEHQHHHRHQHHEEHWRKLHVLAKARYID